MNNQRLDYIEEELENIKGMVRKICSHNGSFEFKYDGFGYGRKYCKICGVLVKYYTDSKDFNIDRLANERIEIERRLIDIDSELERIAEIYKSKKSNANKNL